VFDGFDLHAKKDTKKKREEKRAKYIKKRDLAKKEGRTEDYIKFNNYSNVIEKKHVVLLMDYLSYAGVEYIVSPYEADAQLAYMHKIGQIDYIVTEDSDLVLYDCENLINKLNQSGYCELLQIKNSNLMYNNSDTEEVEDFVRLSQEQKIWMSLMVGCDYLEKVRGVGLKKGIDLIQNVTSLKELFKKLKDKCKRFDDSKKYKTAFKNCELVFKFQKVYNPFTKELCYFQEPDEHMLKYMRTISNLDNYVGKDFENVEEHIRGGNIRSQVPEKERLTFDFKSLEHKVEHKICHYEMNPISNLVSNDGQNQKMTKDDFDITLNVQNYSNNEDSDQENYLKDIDSSTRTKRVRRKKTMSYSRKFRRSRSNELPSPDSENISIESLKKEFQRPSKLRAGRKTRAVTKKYRVMKKKEIQKTTDSVLQEMLESTFARNNGKPQKSNRSTRMSSKGISHMSVIRQKKRGFPHPQTRYRKDSENRSKHRIKKLSPGSQIIEMGELLEAEESKQKDLSVNISIHHLRLKNDEKTEKLPKSKMIYSKDKVLRNKMMKKTRISKFSQNRMEETHHDFEQLGLYLSDEETPSFTGKRRSMRLYHKNLKKKEILLKKIKIE